MSMIKLSPSILSADFARLGAECQEVLKAGADMIHFDVMDGHFVHNISFGLPVLESIRKALPNAYFDVHLMISDPVAYVRDFADAGANSITVHVEAGSSIRSVLSSIRSYGCDAGVAVNPVTPAERAFPYLEDVSTILVMGVTPGHGGQTFQTETIDKLKQFRSECRRKKISPNLSVDGGIKLASTAPACVEAGADMLVVGSGIFSAKDKAAVVRAFKAL